MIAPDVGLSVMPVGQAPNWAIVAFGAAPPINAGEPLTLSFVTTFAIGVCGEPAAAEPESGLGKIAALTVIVSVTVWQLAGVFRSHNWYVTGYTPGRTVEATVMAPDVVLSSIPAGHTPDCAMVAFAVLPNATGNPLTLSLEVTLAIGVDGVPETAVPFSTIGIMLALTVMVSVTVWQLTGVLRSQSR